MYVNKRVLNKIKKFNYEQLILGGLQMCAYNIPDLVTGNVISIVDQEKRKQNIKDINNKLDFVASKYNGSNQTAVPEKITLEKMEFVKPTESDVLKQGEDSLNDYKTSGVQSIEDEYKLKEDKLYSDKSSVIDAGNKSKQNLKQYYDNAITNAENQALKRGLSRSSIILNQLDAFEKSKIDDYKQIDKDITNQINAINFELNALTSQKQTALNNFDVTYAVKLQEKINNLNKELADKEAEVIKYNNEIALKEAEFNKDVDELKNEISKSTWEDTTDLIDIYGKYGQNVVNKVKNDDIYNTAREYLKSLSQAEVLAILADQDFKHKLGESNFEKILNEFGK